MDVTVFGKGMLVGFFLCAPLGPIGIYCAQRTLSGGVGEGLATVLGAASVDFLYCALAGLGMTFFTSLADGGYQSVRLAGAVVFIIVGTGLFLSGPHQYRGESTRRGLWQAYTFAFLMMLAHPIPLMVFTATFAAFGIESSGENWFSIVLLVSGVTVGSALWSPILVAAVRVFRREFRPDELQFMNKVSGALIVAFGVGIGGCTLIS